MGRTLVVALKACMEMREKLIADGESPVKADAIIGRGLFAEFGQKHAAPYRCPKCKDLGWILHLRDASATYGPNWGPVQVATKCDAFCAFLQWEREQRRQAPGDASDLTAAGRMRRRA